MSELIVAAFDDVFKADEVKLALLRLQQEHLIALDDAVVVVKSVSGKVQIKQSYDLTRTGAVQGGIWGFLFGTLISGPVVGLLAGALSAGVGALSASTVDIGINDDFIHELSRTIQPGTSALFVLASDATGERVIDDLRPFRPRIIHTSLSNDAEARLRAAFDDPA